MPTQSSRFVWFEYYTKEIEKAQRFFGEIFNWSTQQVPMPQGSYTMITAGGQTIGGYLQPPKGAPEHAHWLSHLGVTDVRATTGKIAGLGGKVLAQPFTIADKGTMAVIADPEGAPFALWQATKPEDSPTQYRDKPGHWIWNELYAKDPDKEIAFYRAIGGFEHQKMEMGPMTYHVLAHAGKGNAGVTKSPAPNMPSAWMPYVQVEQVDQTVDKAKRLGATVMVAPNDVPGVGRLAIFSDPQKCPIGVLKPAPM